MDTPSLDDVQEAAANRIDEAASAIHRGANRLSESADTAGDMGRSAADTLHATADYVRDADAAGVMKDVRRVVKENPAAALLVAVAVGFVAGRLFTRSL